MLEKLLTNTYVKCHIGIRFDPFDFTNYPDLAPAAYVSIHVLQSLSTLRKQSLILDCCMHVTCMQHAWKTSQIHACCMKHAYCMHVDINETCT